MTIIAQIKNDEKNINVNYANYFSKKKTQTIDVQCKHDLNDKSYIVNVNCFFYYFFFKHNGKFPLELFQFNDKYILKK